jgi:hypothetical protein
MPFPFLPVGAMVAGLILSAALTVFVLALKALDRAAGQVGGAVVGGLVSGIRDWSAPQHVQVVSPSSAVTPGSADPGDQIEPSEPTAVEPVRRST